MVEKGSDETRDRAYPRLSVCILGIPGSFTAATESEMGTERSGDREAGKVLGKI